MNALSRRVLPQVAALAAATLLLLLLISHTAQAALEGEGTAASPYKIATEADLALLREHPTADFELTANITMTSPWAAVPTFSGVLDGAGHTISGIVLEPTVEGSEKWTAFLNNNTGTVERLGFIDPTSIVSAKAEENKNRAGVIVLINKGTMREDWTEDAVVEGGWRGAPIATMNEALVTDCYSVNSKIVAGSEAGGLVGWTSATGVITDSYVAGANVTSATNSAIFNGYGYAGTKLASDVVYSGALNNTGSNQGRVNARENGTPTYSNNLSLNTATINGKEVTGGTATTKNGKDTTEAELKEESTYLAIGWNFQHVWTWDAADGRPVLRAAVVAAGGQTTAPATYQVSSEAGLALLREHPDATIELTADITLANPWTPIPVFDGTLNGNGHTITGLEVEGASSQAFIIESTGTIEKLGFDEATSKVTGPFEESKRAAIVTSINTGTIKQVYTKDVEIEGGWRGAPIADNNEGTVTDSYTVDSKVVANWESGGLVAWTSAAGQITNSYVAGANVTALVSSGGIFAGYGYTGTKLSGDVIYSGSVVNPSTTNRGRILARENGAPTYEDDLSLNTATINGEAVTGGTATNKNGQDTTEAELEEESTYAGIGWDFTNVWAWDATLGRPVLQGLTEVGEPPAPQAPVITVKNPTLTYQVGPNQTEAHLLTAAEASVDLGSLSIDTSAVNFDLAGEYTAEVEAENEGIAATPVAVTIEVVAVTAISVAHTSVSFPASATTSITEAAVLAAVGANATNGVTIAADISAVRSDVPGSYEATLSATDPFGFTVAPVTVTVEVTAAATQTSLVASESTQTYGTSTPVTLTATVDGGDGTLAGTVGLFDGSTQIAVAPLEGGQASFTVSGTLAVGDHSLTARFIPVAVANAGSESTPVHFSVIQVVTPEGLISTPSNSSNSNPSAPTQTPGPTATKRAKSTKASKKATKTTLKVAKGKRPELTIEVTGGAGKVDGQVQVYVDSKVAKTVTVKNGAAKLALSLKPGTHKVKAVFVGDASLKTSTSATIRVTVG